MTPLPQSQGSVSPPVGLPASGPARPSRLLAGIYHDIGMAAVAIGLELPVESHDPSTHESVKRGSRYIYLMPRREGAPQAAE